MHWGSFPEDDTSPSLSFSGESPKGNNNAFTQARPIRNTASSLPLREKGRGEDPGKKSQLENGAGIEKKRKARSLARSAASCNLAREEAALKKSSLSLSFSPSFHPLNFLFLL